MCVFLFLIKTFCLIFNTKIFIFHKMNISIKSEKIMFDKKMNEATNFSYMNMITCRFSSTNCHILKNPKILPCGFTSCYDCIKSNLQINSQLNCPFEKCKQVHEIDNADNLITNSIIETAIDENMDFLTKNFKNTIQDKLENLTSKLQKSLAFNQL
jgi:hypothetical protein